MNFYQDFIVLDNRLFYFLQFKNIGGAIFLVDNCFHLLLLWDASCINLISDIQHICPVEGNAID